MGSVRDKMVEQIRAAKRASAAGEPVVEVVQEAPVVEMVRARNEEGHFLKDDPSTPENEAWVEKPAAKPKAKKESCFKEKKQLPKSLSRI